MISPRLFPIALGAALLCACTVVKKNPNDTDDTDDSSETDSGADDDSDDDDSADDSDDAADDEDGAEADSGSDDSNDDDSADDAADDDAEDDSAGSDDASAEGDAGAADDSDAGPSGDMDGGSASEQGDAGADSAGDAATGAGDAGEQSVVVDPAPDADAPGDYGCDGCPEITLDEFESPTTESANEFSGSVSGAEGNGEFYVEGEDGQAIGGPIPTDEDGAFAFTAPLFCGTQIVKFVWSNEAGTTALVSEVTREDCVEADIRLTLSWDDLGRDFELHLIKPGGSINDNATDCTWSSCINSQPDWGVQGDASDNPHKDVDNTGSFGPENIVLSDPEEGTYTVMVEHWGGGDAGADGELIFNVAGQTVIANVTDLPSHWVWNVGTISWPSGEISLDGELIDCTGSWASGCTLDLP